MRPFWGLSLAITVTIVFQSTVSHAIDPDIQDTDLKALKNSDGSFRTCGQSCLYSTANENLSLQAVYGYQKAMKVQMKFDELKLESDKIDLIQSNLGSICSTNSDGKPESADDCLNRFKRIQVGNLYEIRGSLSSNMRAIDQLRSEVDPIQGKQTIVFGNGDSEKKALVPHVPTLKDLDERFPDERSNGIRRLPTTDRGLVDSLNRLTSVEFESWANQVTQNPIRKEDFVLFKTVPRDPSDPNSELLWKLDSSCGSPVCFDEKAFQDALALQAKNQPKLVEDFEADRRIYQKTRETLQRMPSGESRSKPSEAPVLNQEAYDLARRAIIEPAQDAIDGKKSGSSKILGLKAKQNENPEKSSPTAPGILDLGASRNLTLQRTSSNASDGVEIQVIDRRTGPDQKNIHVTFEDPGDLDSMIQTIGGH